MALVNGVEGKRRMMDSIWSFSSHLTRLRIQAAVGSG